LAVRRRHAPVVAAPGSLFGGGEDRAEHDGIGAGGEGLAHGTAVAHAAVGDDRDVAAGLAVVGVAGGGRVDRRGDLRDADAEHFAAGAGGAGADADEHAGDAGLHQLLGGGERDGIADDDRHVAHVLDQLVEDEALLGPADVARAGDGRLHDEDVDAGIARDGRELLRVHRRAGYGGDAAALLDLAHALADELGLHRRGVDLLHQGSDFALWGGGDLGEDGGGVVVAGLHALEVEDGEAAELREADGHIDIDHAVHGGGDERELEVQVPQLEGELDEVGVDGV